MGGWGDEWVGWCTAHNTHHHGTQYTPLSNGVHSTHIIIIIIIIIIKYYYYLLLLYTIYCSQKIHTPLWHTVHNTHTVFHPLVFISHHPLLFVSHHTQTWMILEYCDRGSLDEAVQTKCFVRKLDGQPNMGAIYRCLIDIAAGMEYLHHLGIVHGDLKSANVLLKSTAQDPRYAGAAVCLGCSVLYVYAVCVGGDLCMCSVLYVVVFF